MIAPGRGFEVDSVPEPSQGHRDLIAVRQDVFEPIPEPKQERPLVDNVERGGSADFPGCLSLEPGAVVREERGPTRGRVGIGVADGGDDDSPGPVAGLDQRLGPAWVWKAVGFPEADQIRLRLAHAGGATSPHGT